MPASPTTRAAMTRWSSLPLRVIVGAGFLVHGYLKLSRGVDVFAAALAGLGIPAAFFMAWATTLLEVITGIAVLAGAFVTAASVPMVAILIVAIVEVHWQFGFSSIKFLAVTVDGPQFGKPGVECDLLYLACIAALWMLPPDPFAWDARRRRATVTSRSNTRG
jgi:putative oxidoreductase